MKKALFIAAAVSAALCACNVRPNAADIDLTNMDDVKVFVKTSPAQGFTERKMDTVALKAIDGHLYRQIIDSTVEMGGLRSKLTAYDIEKISTHHAEYITASGKKLVLFRYRAAPKDSDKEIHVSETLGVDEKHDEVIKVVCFATKPFEPTAGVCGRTAEDALDVRFDTK